MRTGKLILVLWLLAALVVPVSLTGCASSGFAIRVGPAGGTIEITEPTSPLYGTKVEVPPGALDINLKITVAEMTSVPPSVEGFRTISPYISIEPDGAVFNLPVLVTIPYDGSGVEDANLIIAGTQDGEEDWDITPVADIDTAGGTATIAVRHLTSYWVVYPKDRAIQLKSIDTGFVPGRDGFPIANEASRFGAGECLAFAAFSRWYYNNEKHKTHGHLAEKLCEEQAEALIKDLGKKLPEAPSNWIWPLCEDPGIAATTMKAMMIGSGQPQIAILKKAGATEYTHAIVVYGWDGQNFLTYDSRKTPGTESKIGFDGYQFDQYDSYTSFCPFSSRFSISDSVFQEIYEKYLPYFDQLSIFNNKPTGDITETRPTISADICLKPTGVDLDSVLMTLDGVPVPVKIETIEAGSVIRASYTPEEELERGRHTVTVNARTPEEVKAKEKAWEFEIGPERWDILLTSYSATAHASGRVVETIYGRPVGETGEMTLSAESLGGIGEAWGDSAQQVLETIPDLRVSYQGNTVSASFSFMSGTGFMTSGELIGTVEGDNAYFNLILQVPALLRNLRLPVSHSSEMLEMNGKIYYELPQTITIKFRGKVYTLAGGQKVIQGTYSDSIAEPYGRWLFYLKQHKLVTSNGSTEKKLQFEGTIEWIYSKCRESGDFTVLISDPSAATEEPAAE